MRVYCVSLIKNKNQLFIASRFFSRLFICCLGAPYLPTFSKSMNAMFAQLRREPIRQKKLTFVDLGSGDGRVVFRAAREKMFDKCIGYEINPLLHLFASLQRVVRGPQAWRATRFYLGDLWKVDLRTADVVAVVRPSLSTLCAVFILVFSNSY